ncbi:carotenoid oxygenase family protein [Mycobacterium florentinum]|nr:carotenoid oxygenase family protein [Mycobacterium florentinum]BBX77084.1 carotenoid oxygenase [Mycobacterium florentinum]
MPKTSNARKAIQVPPGLRGPMTPMRFEATVEDCAVSYGQIPRELNGGFYRNGPTWKRPSRQGIDTPYSMDGMIQGLVFRDGRADFRNRWTRTPKFRAEEIAGRALFEWSDGHFGDWRAWALGEVERNEYTRGIPQGTNAVNVVPFGNQLLALGENTAPVALDPITLETIGVVPWSSMLCTSMVEPACFGDGAFAAHPKWDEATGDLFGWSYRDEPPYVTVYKTNPDGGVARRDLWDAPYNTVAHDIWLTERYVVIPFQPFTVGQDRIQKGFSAYAWDPELPISLALVDREDLDRKVQWTSADFPAEYIMHMLSANHIGDHLIQLDAPVFDRPPFQFEDRFAPGDDFVPFWKLATSAVGRWTVNLETGVVSTEVLGDRPVELPKVDERHYGKPYEWAFLTAGDPTADGGMRMNTVIRRNVRTGGENVYRVSDDKHVTVFEGTFAPRSPSSPEGDGFYIVPVSHFAERTSEFLIFDTDSFEDGPITRIAMPFQIGWSPHGHWMQFR